MEIAIYFEGGGNSAETKATLRQGMSAFLKPLVDLARQRCCRWSITSCGGSGGNNLATRPSSATR